jgi:hypothetical protein
MYRSLFYIIFIESNLSLGTMICASKLILSGFTCPPPDPHTLILPIVGVISA